MIYILEKDFNRQIDILEFFLKDKDYNICAWLYPESTSQNIANIPILNNTLNLELVTSYDDKYIPNHTKILTATFEILTMIRSSQKEVQKNCDNITLYPLKSNQWEITIIPHEGICLVKDKAFLSKLINTGYDASLETPIWW
jgi:hypothetical protein